MRVIYLVRSAQLLLTLRALFLLYSVSSFCEQTHHSIQVCSNMIARIPLATPEQIAEFKRLKQQRAAASRAANTTSDASSATSTTTHAPSINQSSTVSTTDEAKKRVKRDDVARELPGNGLSEAQRKAAAAVKTKKDEEKKEGEKKSTAEVKTEAKADEKKEVKKKEAVTTQAPAHHEEKTVEQKSEHTEAKESKIEVKTEEKKKGDQKPASEVKTGAKSEIKADEKKKPEHPSDEKKEVKTVVKKEKPVQTTTEASKEPKKEKKEHLGAEIHIPAASDAHHHEEKIAEGKVDSADLSSPSVDKHRTVKKDLKVHVQEPVKIEDKKKELPPKLTTVHERFVLEHSDAFLQEIRCLEVTAGDYFGRALSPYAQHLKGLVFAGPMLLVAAIYLVFTVAHSLLSTDTPSQFTVTLGCVLHGCLWLVVLLTMTLIYDHWEPNWLATSNDTFKPDFPCQWTALMYLAGVMFLAACLEILFLKRLYYDIVFERSYRCYEVIDDSEAMPNDRRLSRTNVY